MNALTRFPFLFTALAAVVVGCLAPPSAAVPLATGARSELPYGVDRLLRSALEESALDAVWQVGVPIPGVPAAWCMTNRAHDLEVFFTPRGPRVGPRSSGRWGVPLELGAYGRAGAMHRARTPELLVEGARAEYRRAGIVEWYVNDSDGLEQGFDLVRRPAGEGPLRIEVAVRDDLLARVDESGARLVLCDEAGAERVSLAGLFSIDRAGRELATRFAPCSGGFALVVDDEGAEYPIVIDPRIVNEQAVLLPTGGAPGCFFGASIARSGDRVVVSADGDSTLAGAVYVFFEHPTLGWTLEAKLTDGQKAYPGEDFGYSVDLEGTALVVGVVRDRDTQEETGKALLYELGPAGWELSQVFRPADLEPNDRYGQAVSVIRRQVDDQLRVAVGASRGGAGDRGAVYLHQSSPSGSWSQVAKLESLGSQGVLGWSVDQTQWHVAAGSFGRAHVFAWNFAGSWVLQQDLSLAAASGNFGNRVRLPDSGRLFVADSAAQNSQAVNCGGVWMFLRNGMDWTVSALVSPLDGEAFDRFGRRFDVEGDLLVAASGDASEPDLGAAYVWQFTGSTWHQIDRFATPDEPSALDLDGPRVSAGYRELDAALGGEGGAVLYTESGGQWGPEAELQGVNVEPGEGFGLASALQGDTLVIAAPLDSDAAAEAGAVYVYQRSGAVWDLQQKLTAGPFARPFDRFGRTLVMEGDRLAVGASGHDDDGGAVYLYRRVGGTWTLEQRLQYSDHEDDFGRCLALDGDRLLVGARRYTPSSGPAGGAVLYEWDGNAWLEVTRLAIAGESIGSSVALRGDLALVGHSRFDGSLPEQGAVYLFDRTGTSWSFRARIESPEPEAYGAFGFAVALDEGRMVVSSPGAGPGKLSVFRPQAGVWLHDVDLTVANQGAAGIGYHLATEGDSVVTGGVFGNGLYGRGAVHVFREVDSVWFEEARLTSNETVLGDGLGAGVSISGSTVVAGAPGTDEYSGIGYVFELPVPSPFQYLGFGDGSIRPCPCGNDSAAGAEEGCANSTGAGARLRAEGSASLAADDMTITADQVPPGKSTQLFIGRNRLLGLPFGDGLRIATVPFIRIPLRQSSASGSVAWSGLHGTGFWGAGDVRYFQAFYRDPAGPCGSGFNVTNAVQVVFEP